MATIDRIRKLLALAENDAAAPNEADTARVLADRLMAAAGLSEADISDEGVDPVSSVRREPGVKTPPRWAGILATAAARMVGCRVYNDVNVRRLVWVGTDAQRSAAQELHGWCTRQVERLARQAGQDAPAMHRRRWLNAYRIGVASAVAAKVLEMTKSRPAPSVGSAALVRQDAVTAAIKAQMPAVTSGRRVRVDGSGFAAGQAAGSSVELRRGVGGDRSRMLGIGQ